MQGELGQTVSKVHVERPDVAANPAERDADVLAAGTLLGAYRIVRCIGSGGMGVVYEAEHCALQKRVALKVPFLFGSTEEGRARFVLEGKMAARIRHPNVVDITDVGEADNVAYLVMEYLEGQPLSELIDSDGPLEPRVVADIFVPVAAALQEAHRMGIVHCDLKPENIFVTRSVHGNLQPKVLDFGISKALYEIGSPHLAPTNAILGTPQYLSPEQLQSALWATGRSDQYMLGVVMYEAATGTQPFAGHSSIPSLINAIRSGVRKRAKEAYPELDLRLAAIIERAMCISPNGRFLSMTSLGAQLLPLASSDTVNMWARHFSSPILAAAVSPLQKVARWAAASGVAVLFAGLVSWSIARRQSPMGTPLRAPVSEALPAGLGTTPEETPRSREPETRGLREVIATRLPQPTAAKRPATQQLPMKPAPRSGGNAAAAQVTALNTRQLTSSAQFKANAPVEKVPRAAASSGALGNEPLPTDNIDPWQP